MIGRIDDLAALLPARYDVPLGVSRFGDQLEIGEVGRGGVSIRVLDTDPRLLAVSAPASQDEQTLQVRRRARTSVTVGTGPVRLRTPRGEIYLVAPADDAWAKLRRSCVSIQAEAFSESESVAITDVAAMIGIAVAPDRVLTVLPPGVVGSSLFTITGRSDEFVLGEVSASFGSLTVLRVTRLPEGVQPMQEPSIGQFRPRFGDRWYGLIPGVGQPEQAVTGTIELAEARVLQAIPDVPIEGSAVGCPVVVDGALSGLLASGDDGTLLYVDAAVAGTLGLSVTSDRLWSLTLAAQAISLEFHLRFGGFRRGGATELDTNALMADAGLSLEQLDRVRGAAEWVIQDAIEARVRPRWLTTSGSSRFSEAVVAALDQAEEAFKSLGYRRSQSYELDAPRFSLTAAAQQGLAEIGVAVVPSSFGDVRAQLDASQFSAYGSYRLRELLAEELPALDDWDPWAAAPAAGADRPQLLLEVASGLSRRDTGMPEPARTVLAAADSHLYPRWWQTRDDLARLGVPDISADQSLPDFLEAYLGWCLTVLNHVGTAAGSYRYEMGFRIPRSDAATLPAARFGLDVLPSSDTEVHLAGRFSSLVGFAAWVFIELANSVRLAAANPPDPAASGDYRSDLT